MKTGLGFVRMRGTRCFIPALVAFLAHLFSGCARNAPYVSFSIPEEEFRRTAQTIALAPVLGPPDLEVAESLLVAFDIMIEDELLSAGYRCVPVREYETTWDRILKQMGGLYDSLTGEIDELKFDVAREQLRIDLADMYQADYLLYPEVWVVEAPHSSGVAKWDGTSQSVVSFGTRVLNVIDAILNQYDGFLEPGFVDALSLGLVVEDMNGTEVLQTAGGIEVLTKEGMPLFSDPERNEHAVKTALLPLLEGHEEQQGI